MHAFLYMAVLQGSHSVLTFFMHTQCTRVRLHMGRLPSIGPNTQSVHSFSYTHGHTSSITYTHALLLHTQVRQHMGRLPSIDPNTRSVLLCGYPNVGKSSMMNKLTKADVEVQVGLHTVTNISEAKGPKQESWSCTRPLP